MTPGDLVTPSTSITAWSAGTPHTIPPGLMGWVLGAAGPNLVVRFRLECGTRCDTALPASTFQPVTRNVIK